jgi:hypothetical protein
MSYNISGKLFEVTDKIVVTIDTKKFGPRQIKKLATMIRTGYIDIAQENATAQIAKLVLDSMSVPIIHSGWAFAWERVPPDNEDFFQRLIASGVHYDLNKKGPRYGELDHRAHYDRLAETHAPNGSTFYMHKSLAAVFKGFSFTHNEYEIPEFIEMNMRLK